MHFKRLDSQLSSSKILAARRTELIARAFSTKMAPIKSFDYLVIGGGSGGLASARKAAGAYGVKVGLIEGSGRLGGTCVNVGCVPKKVMWNVADMAEHLADAAEYGFKVTKEAPFDWAYIKKKRDAYIKRLNGIYERNIEKDSVEWISGMASFKSKNEVEVEMYDGSGKQTIAAKKILVAVGGRPVIPKDIPGAELGIHSDGFFDLETQPKVVALVGAGYIAVEFAGIFNALGSETHMFIRHDKFLRSFDPMIQDTIQSEYVRHGINIHKKTNPTRLSKLDNGRIKVEYEGPEGKSSLEVDAVIWAIGRVPETDRLKPANAGLVLDKKGYVVVDKYQNSNVENIYSLGDVCGKMELTPVAIAAGRKLSDRLFGGFKDAHISYEDVPSTVFAHPEVGTIGLSEQEAKDKYGEENLKVYTSSFTAMYYAMLEDKKPTKYKIVCEGRNERVVGLHLIGQGSSEILQGFGVAIKMGATKADFDSCIAIHPTSAEELVTMK